MMNSSESQMTNLSGNQNQNIKLSIKVATAVQSTIVTVGIVANLLLITAHIKDPFKMFKTSSSTFILNIAVVDFIVSFIVVIKTLLEFTIPDYGPSFINTIITQVWLGAMTISPPSFLSLSIERFCSVVFPLWHRVRFTTRVCRYWLGTLWLLHLTLQALIGLIPTVRNKERYSIQCFYCGLSFLSTQVIYLGTYYSLKNQRTKLLGRQDIKEVTFRTMKIRLENEKRFLFATGVVCFILVLTVLPGLALLVLHAFSPDVFVTYGEQFDPISWTFIIIFNINFAINPFVYVWRLPKYRKTFETMYCKF